MTGCFLLKAGRHPQEVPFQRRGGGPQKETDNVRTGVVRVRHEPLAGSVGRHVVIGESKPQNLG